jgi:hypothetical protein
MWACERAWLQPCARWRRIGLRSLESRVDLLQFGHRRLAERVAAASRSLSRVRAPLGGATSMKRRDRHRGCLRVCGRAGWSALVGTSKSRRGCSARHKREMLTWRKGRLGGFALARRSGRCREREHGICLAAECSECTHWSARHGMLLRCVLDMEPHGTGRNARHDLRPAGPRRHSTDCTLRCMLHGVCMVYACCVLHACCMHVAWCMHVVCCMSHGVGCMLQCCMLMLHGRRLRGHTAGWSAASSTDCTRRASATRTCSPSAEHRGPGRRAVSE